MYLSIFFIEVIFIFFYLTWKEADQYLPPPQENYSSYYSEDLFGNSMLNFPQGLNQDTKLSLLLKSELFHEIIQYSPNIVVMSDILTNGIKEESAFKKAFIYYMEEQHRAYIGGEITEAEFQELIKNPRNLNDIKASL